MYAFQKFKITMIKTVKCPMEGTIEMIMEGREKRDRVGHIMLMKARVPVP